MYTGRPSKSVPGGCLVGFFALLSGSFAGLCAYALFISYKKENLEHLEKLWIGLGLSLVIFLVLSFLATGLHKRIGRNYDPNNPDEPRAKF